MQDALQWLPDSGAPQLLFILLHDDGDDPRSLEPLAAALRQEFPQTAVLAPRREPALDGEGAQPLRRWIEQAQQRLGVAPAATALAGLGAGADAAWQAVHVQDGIAGRALLFGSSWPQLPERAPRLTTLHLLHGSADANAHPAAVQGAFEQFAQLQADATLDVAHGVGHVVHPALIDRLIHRLRHHIPMRTWREALGTVPAMSEDASGSAH